MILLISAGDFFSDYGGGQVYLRNLVAGFSQQQVACSVLSIKSSASGANIKIAEQLFEGTRIYKLTVPIEFAVHAHLNPRSRLIEQIKCLLKEVIPDIVHAHGFKAHTALACAEIGVPCVVTAHHGGLVCPNGTLLHSDGQICRRTTSMNDCLPCVTHTLPGGKLFGPVVRALPGGVSASLAAGLKRFPNIPSVTPSFSAPLAITNKLAEIEVLKKHPVAIVAPSQLMAQALAVNGIDASKIRVMPHGIPLLARQPLPNGFGKRPLRFLFLGRVSEVKGLHVLLKALADFESKLFELHIVGGAATRPERRYLSELVKKYAKPNIIWHGKASKSQVPQWLSYCDLVVHPTICLEVFGLSIAEALATGRPVLASRCGGAEMQIQHGVNGWLVPANDVAALRAQLEHLVTHPNEVHRVARQIGNVRGMEEHVAELLSLYREFAPSIPQPQPNV
jgi:glycosyltransferase involved in cell wall biosynthesis